MRYKNAFDFKEKVILITGGGGDVGREFARAFAQCGGKKIIADISLKKAQAVSKELSNCGEVSLPVHVDVSNLDSIKSLVQNAIEKFGKIDILLNHAGLNIRKPAIDFTDVDWEKIINVNLKGEFFVAQEVGKYMIKEKKGKLLIQLQYLR